MLVCFYYGSSDTHAHTHTCTRTHTHTHTHTHTCTHTHARARTWHMRSCYRQDKALISSQLNISCISLRPIEYEFLHACSLYCPIGDQWCQDDTTNRHVDGCGGSCLRASWTQMMYTFTAGGGIQSNRVVVMGRNGNTVISSHFFLIFWS